MKGLRANYTLAASLFAPTKGNHSKGAQLNQLQVYASVFFPPGLARVAAESCSPPRSEHLDVTLLGGLAAGTFTPWEPRETSGVTTLEKCASHCCGDPRVELMFMVNQYCFCVQCRSRRLCTPVKITPPHPFRSYAVVFARGTCVTVRDSHASLCDVL